jgi:hypothetical protein
MDKSHLEACRLNLQYFLFREVFQFRIHPSVQLPDSNDHDPIRIVEVAVADASGCSTLRAKYPMRS